MTIHAVKTFKWRLVLIWTFWIIYTAAVGVFLCVSFVKDAQKVIKEAQKEFCGVPISAQTEDLAGKIFYPKAILFVRPHLLVYDRDGKVYDVSGMILDNETNPKQFTGIVSNATYHVYQKNGQLYFHDENLYRGDLRFY